MDILVREGKVRRDGDYTDQRGLRKAELYTLTSLWENVAIDIARSNIREKHTVTWERRFVRIGNMNDVDAILKTEDFITFLIEVKFARKIIDLSKVLSRLSSTAKKFEPTSKAVIIFLVLVSRDDSQIKSLENYLDNTTFDTGNIETRFLLLSTDQLEEESQKRFGEKVFWPMFLQDN